MSNYRVEFPDYPEDAIPAELLTDGWHDVSWHNEACPSFLQEEKEYHRIVYVDYPDAAMRENPDCARFGVILTKDGHFRDDDPRLDTCSLDEALSFQGPEYFMDSVNHY